MCLRGYYCVQQSGPVLRDLRTTVVPIDHLAAVQRTQGWLDTRNECCLLRGSGTWAAAVVNISPGVVAIKREGDPGCPLCVLAAHGPPCPAAELPSGVEADVLFLAPSFTVHGFECSQAPSI